MKYNVIIDYQDKTDIFLNIKRPTQSQGDRVGLTHTICIFIVIFPLQKHAIFLHVSVSLKFDYFHPKPK